MTSLNSSERCFQTTKVNISVIFCTLWIWFPNIQLELNKQQLTFQIDQDSFERYLSLLLLYLLLDPRGRFSFHPLETKWKTILWDLRESTSKTKTQTNKTKIQNKTTTLFIFLLSWWHTIFRRIIGGGAYFIFFFLHQKGTIIRGRLLFQILLTWSRALNILFYYPV